VDTRLRRLTEGRIDGVVLAAAGLARLRVDPEHLAPMPIEEMVPAPGQGALAVQTASGLPAEDAVAAIDHPPSHRAFEAERRLVSLLGGGCRLPLGAYAEARDGLVSLLAVVVRPDGSDLLWSQAEAASPGDAAGQVAEALRSAGADQILGELRG
jgi:hydroxymethylbilane synthase